MSKRQNDESASGSHPPRAKRDRYTTIACNECKKRKVKCNGEAPCERCSNLETECVYARKGNAVAMEHTEDFKRMETKILSLQAQVDVLFANFGPFLASSTHSTLDSWTEVPNGQGLPVSTTSQAPTVASPARSKRPQFFGPTSSAFGFKVANSSLRSMGIRSGTKAGGQDMTSHPVSPSESPVPSPHLALDRSRDPLWLLEKDEALRLIRLYEEEIGSIYPFLDANAIANHVIYFYTHPPNAPMMTSATGSNLDIGGLTEHDIEILKLVLATALIVDGKGESDLGAHLVDSIESSMDGRMRNARADKHGMLRLMLESHYRFHSDDEALAWRTIGLVARMALEMGLHRRESLFRKFPEEQQRLGAINLFWCIYVLDRRWSFGTGLPFALHDSDIDPDLPEPDNSTPYLTCMVAWGRIGSKVWESVATSGDAPNKFKKDKSAYLDFQILQWQRSIPKELQFIPPSDPALGPPQRNRANYRHRVLLHLRAIQMRTMVHRQNVLSASSVSEDLPGAALVVDLAKETIRILNHLDQTTDIYRSQQICFNYFLVSALAILFLAVCHAPGHFSQTSRDEYYMALDLVKGFSAKSAISRRLWKTIEDLKVIGPKLGIISQQDKRVAGDDVGTHINEGVVSGLPSYPTTDEGLDIPLDMVQMSYELTTLFEGAGRTEMEGRGTSGAGNDLDMMPYVFGDDGSLSRILGDLF